MNRIYNIAAIAVIAIAFLCGCGSGGSVPAGPTGPDIIGNTDNPGLNGPTNPDTPIYEDKVITIQHSYPTPARDFTGEIGDGQIQTVEYDVNLAKFITDIDLIDKSGSALTNNDREKAEEVLNSMAWKLFQDQQSSKSSGEGFGNWEHTFYWQSDDTVFYRNVQAVTWLGLLQYIEVFDLYDPSDPTKTSLDAQVQADLQEFLDHDTDGSDPDTADGFLGARYDAAIAASDADASTSADRPYANEVILLSRAANYFSNSAYQDMAETWFGEIYDEFTGAEFATRVIDNRNSLSLWDLEGYESAAVLTGYFDFVDFDSGTDTGRTALFDAVTDEDDGIVQEIIARQLDWENVLYGGFDYTNLGWSIQPRALSELSQYWSLTVDGMSLYGDAFLNTTGNSFRNRSYGYFGYTTPSTGDLVFDDSQYNGYAMLGLGHANQNDYEGTNATLFDVLDGPLEWVLERVGNDVSSNTDIDGDGIGDAGAVRGQFRGGAGIGLDGYNYEVLSELLAGGTIASEEFRRFPDIPLP